MRVRVPTKSAPDGEERTKYIIGNNEKFSQKIPS